MSWIDDILERCPPHLHINDSKTPSGVAHVGSLRGVLIHDALLRAARHRGMQARFSYGCDDMDPVDEMPHGTGEHFRRHLGKPLVRAPAPPGYEADNMAQAYFGEFTAAFAALGVAPDYYSMSDLYRRGRLDDAIDTYLRRAADVRGIYARESGAVRREDWLPFQPICENCGRIGTTFASDYDGETVAYACETDLVKWAEGCESTGRVSPFGGNGKLPWKLEWAAKWQILEPGLEGSGKDHMSASGSFAVASALAREVLGCEVPQVFAYEFFTVDGSKMSSSRGVGISASGIAATLPPELLRYLVLRAQPRRALDFDIDIANLTKAFAEYERLWRSVCAQDATDNQRQLFALSSRSASGRSQAAPTFSPPFDSVVSVVTQPHISLAAHVASLGVAPLSEQDLAWLEVKAQTARSWSTRYSESAARLTVLEDFLPAVRGLSNQQRAFLAVCAVALEHIDEWSATSIQAAMFDAARSVSLSAAPAFEALYMSFFGWPEGPRAGAFLEFTGRQETLSRLVQVDFSYRKLLEQTAVRGSEWERALTAAWSASQAFSVLVLPLCADLATGRPPRVEGALELFVVDDKQRTSALRTPLRAVVNDSEGADDDETADALDERARSYVAGLLGIAQSDIPVHPFDPFSRAAVDITATAGCER